MTRFVAVVHRGHCRRAVPPPWHLEIWARTVSPLLLGAYGLDIDTERAQIGWRNDDDLLRLAIEQAEIGLAEGGIPIGAVLAVGDDVLGAGRNRRVQWGSAIRHGETDALEQAGRLPASTYARATMYTTLSPCHMCTGAILLYGIRRVVIGEHRTFMGAEDLLRANGVEVVNLDSDRCVELLTSYIIAHPALWLEDIGEPDE